MRLTGPQLELNLEPTAHCARHALLHMAPKWSGHRTTWAGSVNYIHCENSQQLNCMHIFAISLRIYSKLMQVFAICHETDFYISIDRLHIFLIYCEYCTH